MHPRASRALPSFLPSSLLPPLSPSRSPLSARPEPGAAPADYPDGVTTAARRIGDLDLHLFGEGTHRRLWELLGPQLLLDRNGGDRVPEVDAVRFTVWAPNAAAVSVVGDWNGWQPEPLDGLSGDGPTGLWSAVAERARPGDR